MSLPALRLAYLRRDPSFERVQRGLRAQLIGRVIAIPASLSQSEREEIVDAILLFVDLPVLPVRSAGEFAAGEPAIWLVLDMVDTPPEPIPDSIVVCTRRRCRDGWHLDIPGEIITLRDAIVECLGRRHSGTPLAHIASWAELVTDSPVTALRFADGVLERLERQPDASDGALCASGIGAAIGWLLRGVDRRVAEWLLAVALAGRDAERVVDTDAALLGRDAALKWAFEQGLVEALPDIDGDPVDLRRPFDVLSRWSEAPGSPTIGDLIDGLNGQVSGNVWMVAMRPFSVAAPPLGLDLPGPKFAGPIFGREEILRRLTALFEPANEIRTVVLQGMAGVGKSAVARALGDIMVTERETVWVSFANGAEAGWLSVAERLKIDVNRPGTAALDSRNIPNWVHRIHDRLRSARCLLVVDDVDGVPEVQLPDWLPAGSGKAAVLVLSRAFQRQLQQQHDAVVVRLSGLAPPAARQLLVARMPAAAEIVDHGGADALIARLGGMPGALAVIARGLERESPAELLVRLERPAALADDDPIVRAVGPAASNLTEQEQAIIETMTICAPGGALIDLVAETAGIGIELVGSSIDHLIERSLVTRDGLALRLPELVRLYFERFLRERPERARGRELNHLRAILVSMYDERSEFQESLAYENICFAVERASRNADDAESVMVLEQAAVLLRKYRRRNISRNIRLALAAFQRIVTFVPRGSDRWLFAVDQIGVAWSTLPTGNRADNLREAIRVLSAAAAEESSEASVSNRAAIIYSDLSYALAAMPSGHPEANRAAAVEAAEKAIRSLGSAEKDGIWAYAHVALGIALTESPKKERPSCLRLAIAAFEQALSVQDYPAWSCAEAHRKLAHTLVRLASFDGPALLDWAIAECERALAYYSRDDYREEWAKTQRTRAQALIAYPDAASSESTARAIEILHDAMTVSTREDFPRDWARLHKTLATAYEKLPTGNPADNLRRAIEADENALSVITPDEYPSESRQIREHAESLRARLREIAAAN